MKVAILFPGQGSQYLGMGQDFIEQDSQCLEIMEKTESVCNAPIGKFCQEGPLEELSRAVHLQPAITAVNMICWKMLQKKVGDKIDFSFFAGHSLGEYSALHAAAVLSLEDTIALVAKRGALMEREGQLHPGGMRAVIGLTIAEIEELISTCSDEGIVTAANHNTEQQIVVSGDMTGLDELSSKVEKAGARVVALNVSVANHSPLVADAVPDFSNYMEDVKFSKPLRPVLFNVTAGQEEDGDAMKRLMAGQIASRVRWFEIINHMISNGVDTFIEVGPKTVLKGMMRKIVPKGVSCTSLQFDTPSGLEKCISKLV